MKLVNDVIYNILNCLAGTHSLSTLRSWTLTNRLWFRIATPLLWQNPFADDVKPHSTVCKSRSLLIAYVRSLPEEERRDIELRGTFANNSSTVNYAQFITV